MWVDNMVDNLTYSYLYTKRDVYYFSKHVPKDIRSYYKRDRIVICLKTKSQFAASRASKSLIQRLEDYWMSLRLSTLNIPPKHLLKNSISTSNSPTLTVALQTYFKMKGNGKSRVFYRAGQRNINTVINLLGDRPIDEYSTSDASSLRDHLIEKRLKIASITRMFSTIKSVINLTIREEGLKVIMPFQEHTCLTWMIVIKDNP